MTMCWSLEPDDERDNIIRLATASASFSVDDSVHLP